MKLKQSLVALGLVLSFTCLLLDYSPPGTAGRYSLNRAADFLYFAFWYNRALMSRFTGTSSQALDAAAVFNAPLLFDRASFEQKLRLSYDTFVEKGRDELLALWSLSPGFVKWLHRAGLAEDSDGVKFLGELLLEEGDGRRAELVFKQLNEPDKHNMLLVTAGLFRNSHNAKDRLEWLMDVGRAYYESGLVPEARIFFRRRLLCYPNINFGNLCDRYIRIASNPTILRDIWGDSIFWIITDFNIGSQFDHWTGKAVLKASAAHAHTAEGKKALCLNLQYSDSGYDYWQVPFSLVPRTHNFGLELTFWRPRTLPVRLTVNVQDPERRTSYVPPGRLARSVGTWTTLKLEDLKSIIPQYASSRSYIDQIIIDTTGTSGPLCLESLILRVRPSRSSELRVN